MVIAALAPQLNDFGLARDTLAKPAVESRCVPIGKQLRPDRDEWECLFGADEAGTSVSSGSSGTCSQHLSSLEELQQHYYRYHSPFENPDYMWRCLNCGFNWPDLLGGFTGPNESCPQQCGVRNHQRWYWGEVQREIDLFPGRPAIQVSSREPPATRPAPPPPSYSQNSSSAGAHSFPGVFQFTGDAGSSGSGGGQYWKAGASRVRSMKRSIGAFHHPCEALGGKKAKMPPFGSGASMLLPTLSLVSFCLAELWLWLSANSSPAFRAPAGVSFLDLALSLVPELSLACVAAGVVGTWLFRHVRDRWGAEHQWFGEVPVHDGDDGNGYYDDMFSISKREEALSKSVSAAIAA